MNLPLLIARRYLIAKKSHSAINVISLVSVCGVAVTTLALICALSVFNGFQSLIASLYSSLDPQIRIVSVAGKTIDTGRPEIEGLAAWPEVEAVAPVLEEYALLVYRDRQVPARLKGVPDNYAALTRIDSVLLDGRFRLNDSVAAYVTLGVGLANRLGTGAGGVYPLQAYAPRRGAKINPANPMAAFAEGKFFLTGVFSVSQPEYDDLLAYVPLDSARRLFRYDREASAVELRLRPGTDESKFVSVLQRKLGPEYQVQNRMQQQEASFRIMQIEKWITFLILGFILMIATFNVIGSLSMLILEKQADVRTLLHLGADRRFVSRIFLFEGWFISLLGAGGGLAVGVALCLLQQRYGWLRLGQSAGAFVVDAYPVEVQAVDVAATLLLVALLGFVAAWYPVRDLRRRLERESE